MHQRDIQTTATLACLFSPLLQKHFPEDDPAMIPKVFISFLIVGLWLSDPFVRQPLRRAPQIQISHAYCLRLPQAKRALSTPSMPLTYEPRKRQESEHFDLFGPSKRSALPNLLFPIASAKPHICFHSFGQLVRHYSQCRKRHRPINSGLPVTCHPLPIRSPSPHPLTRPPFVQPVVCRDSLPLGPTPREDDPHQVRRHLPPLWPHGHPL